MNGPCEGRVPTAGGGAFAPEQMEHRRVEGRGEGSEAGGGVGWGGKGGSPIPRERDPLELAGVALPTLARASPFVIPAPSRLRSRKRTRSLPQRPAAGIFLNRGIVPSPPLVLSAWEQRPQTLGPRPTGPPGEKRPQNGDAKIGAVLFYGTTGGRESTVFSFAERWRHTQKPGTRP